MKCLSVNPVLALFSPSLLGGALALAWMLTVPTVPAIAGGIKIYAAGSLSGVMPALIEASGLPTNTFAEPVYGPSGLLVERLGKGEQADLLASADLAAPKRLAAARTGVMVVPFVRNRMCIAAKPSVGLTQGNMLDKMLSPGLRLATSTPGNDPGGDYALAVFRRADALHPGAEKTLTGKMMMLVGGPDTMVPVPGRSLSATIFLRDHADLFMAYCSSAEALLKEVPDLTNVPLPETLEVHPVYGLGLLSDDAAAERFALFVLSLKGQEILATFGFEPLALAP